MWQKIKRLHTNSA